MLNNKKMSKKDMSLKCFSPEVMLATFIIEVFSAIYVLFKYKKSRNAKLIIFILFCLAVFQASEYMVCEKLFFFSSETWARIGYTSIAFLPALGFHLGIRIYDKETKLFKFIKWVGYLAVLFFVVMFLGFNSGFSNQVCLGNYVIFYIDSNLIYAFAVYYYAFLMVGMIGAWNLANKSKSKKTKKALRWLAVSYGVFIFPTTLVNVVNPETINGIPSIMCGFAVLMALIMLWQVAPNCLDLIDAKNKSKK